MDEFKAERQMSTGPMPKVTCGKKLNTVQRMCCNGHHESTTIERNSPFLARRSGAWIDLQPHSRIPVDASLIRQTDERNKHVVVFFPRKYNIDRIMVYVGVGLRYGMCQYL